MQTEAITNLAEKQIDRTDLFPYKEISVVVPCYNEEAVIDIFYREMERVKKEDFDEEVTFKYIFVDDGSSDRTADVLKRLSYGDENVTYISFSRNFGKEAAIIAGLEAANSELVTLMDADLQDPPFMLRSMYEAIAKEGYDQVGTRRTTRKNEPVIRSLFARAFYKFINSVSDVKMTDGARDYRLMKRCVVDAILSLPEKSRFTKGIFSFVGFDTKWLEYENVERAAGSSKWSFFKLFKYAIEGIVSFSFAPLSALFILGVISFLLSGASVVAAVVTEELLWAMIATGLAVAGACEFSCGVLGLYLSQSFKEVKNRPTYIVKDTNIKK